jgi:hypothetical protein
MQLLNIERKKMNGKEQVIIDLLKNGDNRAYKYLYDHLEEGEVEECCLGAGLVTCYLLCERRVSRACCVGA